MLCQGQTCSLPLTTPEALIEVIEARRRLRRPGSSSSPTRRSTTSRLDVLCVPDGGVNALVADDARSAFVRQQARAPMK